ncbi:MAG: type II toxin-antitoxin system Phd/YefM family antitoxin [Anaerolineaceae bacterium]|nr:MAG: type II toxin-antitoxin system Phd/YefM family antitoxin [Anaerolineaceae bacterium]
MPTLTVQSGEARAKFRDLLDQVMAGKDVIIQRNGKNAAVLIPASDYEELRGQSSNPRAIHEAAVPYKTVKVGPAIINAEENTATIPLDFYNALIEKREELFNVIREIQDNAPDLPEEEIQEIVEDAIRIVRAKNAASGS